ncbi:MAG: hypothetical protein UHZ06_06480 [Paludibacteraceae bacterium]|nr:hypothetical protein [Paludibacteraceae bacterium]
MNPAFNAIDTAIKANEVTAGTASTDATTAKNNIGTMANLETTEKSTLVGAINEVNTKAGTAQTTANNAVAGNTETALALNAFMRKFNLSTIVNSNATATSGAITNQLTLAQNSDGSIFKFYGYLQLNAGATMARTAIPGATGWYGVDTNLVLTKAPTSAYIIKCAGFYSALKANMANAGATQGDYFYVGTNGHIYIGLAQSNTPLTTATTDSYDRHVYMPCIYFNADFGDEPEQ